MKTELVTSLKREATKILAELHQAKEPVLGLLHPSHKHINVLSN